MAHWTNAGREKLLTSWTGGENSPFSKSTDGQMTFSFDQVGVKFCSQTQQVRITYLWRNEPVFWQDHGCDESSEVILGIAGTMPVVVD